jgi:DNA-binding MarR family transcriptional regulator
MVPDAGLRRSDAAVLRALSECGELRTGDIAHKLRVDASVVSRQLATLISDGLVSRHQDSADARASLNALTDLGRQRLAALYATYAERLHTALGDLSEHDLLVAADALRRVAAAIAPAQNGVR